MSRLIVKDLPKNITEAELRNRFSEKGTLTECSLRYTPEGVFRKFAFVGYKEVSKAEEALQYFNNSYINATKIKVAIATDFKNSDKIVTWSKYSKQKRETQTSNSSSSSEKQSSYNWAIKVTGLPPAVKKNQIEEFFKPIKIFVNMSPSKKVNTKIIVCFESEKERDEAMRRNKNYIGSNKIFLHKHTGQPITISNTEAQPQSQDKTKEDKEKERSLIAETGRLFIRNLSYYSTEEELQNLFSQYGPVTVELQVDKFENSHKGFALINYVMPENALAAYEELDGTIFQGRMLHILGGMAKKEDTEDLENMPFSKKKEILKKKSAGSAQRWNTLFIGQDALVEVATQRENMEKRDYLLDDGKDSVAAKLALMQTTLVNEMRQFLIQNGVCLDSFGQASTVRSKSILLAKNLPAGTTEKELRDIFSDYANSLQKIIIPPYGLSAIIQFNNEVLASQAFKDLAYSKIKHLPLYLEWAPVDVLSDKGGENKETKTKDDGVEMEDDTKVKEDEDEDATNAEESESEEEESLDVDLSLPRRFVFVKNIPVSCTKEKIQEVFGECGKVVSINFINYKVDDNNEVTSAFVEYGLPQFAENCVRTMIGKDLEGQKLEVKISDRPGSSAPKSQKSEKRGKRSKKEDKEVTTKIMIKNVPFEASMRDLKQLFRNYPGVQKIRMPKKAGADPGSHKGFAFVEFNTKLSAKGAFEELRHNTTLFGRRLVLEWSRSSQNYVTGEDVAHLRKRTAENYSKSSSSKKRKMDLLSDLQGGDK